MKHLAAFSAFLTNTVNLNQSRLDQLDTHVAAIVSTLESDSTFGWRVESHIRQGSWAHRTIIRPLPGDEFDADILLQLSEEPDWECDPAEYLRQLRAAFQRSTVYNGKVKRKNRCVRVDYAGDCHVDVVPCVVRDGQTLIVCYDEDKFEQTNPAGFTTWMKNADTAAHSNLRKVIRLMKYLRDYKNTFSIPSVILTTLLGSRVRNDDVDGHYSDLPTALKTLVTDLDEYLAANPWMPYLEDPSCPGTSFNHRWTQEAYENFATKIGDYLEWITDAYDEPDPDKSLTKWQRVFGSGFTRPVVKESSSLALSGALTFAAPGEQFIEDLYPVRRTGGITLDARISRQSGFEEGWLSRVGSVYKGKTLNFRATVDVDGPFDLYWKVRNTGNEAMAAQCLRGQIYPDEGSHTRRESTLYAGAHYVEAYAIQGGQVVATGHIEVPIRD